MWCMVAPACSWNSQGKVWREVGEEAGGVRGKSWGLWISPGRMEMPWRVLSRDATNCARWNDHPGFRCSESRRQKAVDLNPATAEYYFLLRKEGVDIWPLSPRFSISVFPRCENGSYRCPEAQPWGFHNSLLLDSIHQSKPQANPGSK